MGPLMLDLSDFELTAEEKEILAHPAVGGVIYFTRNYAEPEQITDLVKQTRRFARNDLLLAVDHEGGRVQRFRDGFTAIPAMATFSQAQHLNQEDRLELTEAAGWLMASEVRAVGIDISFAPVLDIHGISDVIGDRSFSAEAEEIVTYAKAFIQGMKSASMLATGKHFPGHGNVKEDSHVALPVDNRDLSKVLSVDAEIFKALIAAQDIAGIMPAHVIYDQVDPLPAGFSKYWLQDVLRKDMGFDGVIFSDDLAMHGALHLGNPTERAHAALEAGCDMVLMCNDREGAVHILDNLDTSAFSTDRLAELRKPFEYSSLKSLQNSQQWLNATRRLEQLNG